MGTHQFRDRVRQFKNFFESISILQKNSRIPTNNPETLKLAKALGLLCLAILLGGISKWETEASARNSVLNAEWPPVQIWSGVLLQGGWKRSGPSDFSTLLKNHPDPFTVQATIWESEDHCLIYLTHSPYRFPESASSETELWTCATSRSMVLSKIRWRRLGSGYDGINQLAVLASQLPKKDSSYIDPKEIRY